MITASYEFYGRAPYPLIARGGRIGYLTNGGLETELAHIISNHSVLMTDFRYRETTLMVKSSTGQYAYVGAGIGYRQVNLSSEVFLQGDADNGNPRVPVREQYKALTANLVLGFEAVLGKHFVLGFDLFSISSPVYWIKRSNNFPDNSEDYEEDPKSLPFIKEGLGTSYQMARTFIKVRL